jgi:hypothetical protein
VEFYRSRRPFTNRRVNTNSGHRTDFNSSLTRSSQQFDRGLPEGVDQLLFWNGTACWTGCEQDAGDCSYGINDRIIKLVGVGVTHYFDRLMREAEGRNGQRNNQCGCLRQAASPRESENRKRNKVRKPVKLGLKRPPCRWHDAGPEKDSRQYDGTGKRQALQILSNLGSPGRTVVKRAYFFHRNLHFILQMCSR